MELRQLYRDGEPVLIFGEHTPEERIAWTLAFHQELAPTRDWSVK